MKRKPLITIGVPKYGDVTHEFHEDQCRFWFHLGRRMPEFDFHLAAVPKMEQFRARNAIVAAAQVVGADYLLMLDDDMIINPHVTSGPTDDYGFLARMVEHDKDVIGALYYQRMGACSPVLMTEVGDGAGYRCLREDEVTHGMQRVDVAGGGCLLIKMRVFDRIPMPYFSAEHQYGTDVQLCRAATQHGFEVWADTSIELGHLRSEKAIVSSANRKQFITDSVPGEASRDFIQADVFNRLEVDACRYLGVKNTVEMFQKYDPNTFMQKRKTSAAYSALPLHVWYQQFAKERVSRQVWFNTTHEQKRAMTEFIVASIGAPKDGKALDILDFGCGIGVPAYTLAEMGHRVTACDLVDTGTLAFLKWRASLPPVPLTIHGVPPNGVPHFGDQKFDAIIAMDCLEHIPGWRSTLAMLVSHLKTPGVLFCNNAILDDQSHPEHIDLRPEAFRQAITDERLTVFNDITFRKLLRVEEPTHAKRPHPASDAAVRSLPPQHAG